MEKKGPVQDLEKLPNLYISSGDKETVSAEDLPEPKGPEPKEMDPAQETGEFEVEERVSVRKRIAYPDTQGAQEDIKRSLFKHLEEDYSIRRVELKKTAQISSPKNIRRTKEEILIFIKESPSH